MSGNQENFPLSDPKPIDKPLPKKGNIQSDLLLLLVAFGLSLLGIWLGSQWINSKNTDVQNGIVKSDEIAEIKKQVADLTNRLDALSVKVDDIGIKLTTPLSTTTASSPAPHVEDDIALAKTFLSQNQVWTVDSEKLMNNLERKYKSTQDKTFKNKISTVLQDMYNSYINYLRLLPDPTIAKEKLKKYQGNNAKSYPLTDAQKKKINGLAQSL